MIPLLSAALALSLAASPSLAPAPTAPDWKPVIASVLLPGAGQYMQAQQARALGQFGAAMACLAAFAYAQAQATNTTGEAGVAPNVRNLASAGLVGLAIWSPLDAWLFEQRHHVLGNPASPSPSGENIHD